MKWQQGRADIDKMLADGELERVQASREHADRLINQARRHLDSAEATCESDPEGCLRHLVRRRSQGAVGDPGQPRAATHHQGGHLAVYHAVKAQLDPPMGQQLRPFDRMRRQRHDAEYPQIDTPELQPDDIRDDLPKIRAIIDIAERVLDNMSVY